MSEEVTIEIHTANLPTGEPVVTLKCPPILRLQEALDISTNLIKAVAASTPKEAEEPAAAPSLIIQGA